MAQLLLLSSDLFQIALVGGPISPQNLREVNSQARIGGVSESLGTLQTLGQLFKTSLA